jgi:segregation and condensation protein B
MSTSVPDNSIPDDLIPDDSFWGQLDDDVSPEPADWSGDDLEQAYLRAMEVLEASEAQFPEIVAAPPIVESDSDSVVSADGELLISSPGDGGPGDVEGGDTGRAKSVVDSPDRIDSTELAAELTELSAETARQQAPSGPPTTAVTPRQILEALMFVGGEPLTTRKLSNVLRGEFTVEFIESELDALNSLYSREGRPYEIRLGEGGYRMTLREEFERIRRKTYGLGPKEVKLSQEAIEVLALIAYHQPLTAAAIEELGKPGCGAVIRQLLRRELIEVERTPGKPRDVAYRTTPRFLSLFGIRNLNELPRLEHVGYK